MSKANENSHAALSGSPIHETDLKGIQTATQWLLGAFGAFAAIIFTGSQLSGSFSVLSSGGYGAYTLVAGSALIIFGLLSLTRAAARVLVPEKTNLTNLIEYQARTEAKENGIKVSSENTRTLTQRARRDSDSVLEHVTNEINHARGWLFPLAFKDLDAAYQGYRARTADNSDSIRIMFQEIMSFAKAEAASYRYEQLVKKLLGWSGLAVVVGTSLLAVSLAPIAKESEESAVLSPYAVAIYFTGSEAELQEKGVQPMCQVDGIKGIAVAGTHNHPVVALSAPEDCRGTKILVSDNIGVALPILK